MAEFRSASEITNAISGLQIVQNGTNDYSLKAISGDASKNVTLVRYKGESAEGDVQVVYQLFVKLFEVLGVEA